MERRLAAILAADVVGYSKLMARDEASTLAALKTHRTEIFDPETKKRGGRIVKLMGDGVLVEFPSVVGAVECAIAVQQAVSRHGGPITLRIGVHLGDMIIEGDDIYGDGVNLSARLETLADPGSVCISDVVRQSIAGKLDHDFEDLGEPDLKNMERPVRVWKWSADREPEKGADNNLQLPDKPSIAVLPFTNLSGDPDQEYFADGMVEEITTALSRMRWLFVIARNSVSTYKDESPELQQVARELGVKYVLQGSVRRAEDQLRINVKLVNAETGKHLWAERYDRQLQSIFAIQDEIATSIVQALKIRLGTQETEALRARATINFEAYDLFLKGQRSFSSRTRENISEAISLYRKAIETDPEFSRAYGATAVAMTFQYRRGFTEAPLETLNLALELAQHATTTGSNIPQAFWSLGYVHLFRKEYEKAAEAVQKAIQISPNYADAYGLLALIYNNQGNAKDAIENITKGMRLNPYYSYDYPYNLGRAQYLVGRYEEAIENLNKALEKNETAPTSRIYLIATYVKAGMIEDAEWEAENLQLQNPEMTISQLRRGSALKDDLMDELALDLRKAGVPE